MIEHSFDRALIIGTFIYIICLGANANVFDLGTRHFETIGNSQLIPEGAVTAIEQDKAGYMWFGTQGGLVRYDGYNFTLFTHKPDDPGSIAGNFILTLWGAPDGRLWIGTIDKGVSVYDPKLDTFTHYKADKNDSGSLSHNWVRAFAGDNQGGVWVGTKDGLNYLPPKKNRFVRFYSEPNNANSLVDSQINALIFSKDNVLWIGTSGGVNKMQSNDWSFTVPFPDSEGQSPFKGQSIRSLLETADSKIWLGTRERGAHWILPDQEYGSLSLDKSKNGYLSHPWVFDMSQPSDREIWFATFGGGISIFDTELNKITQYEKHNPSNSYSINLNDLGSIKTDRSGLIWVGTWGGA